MEMTNKVLKLIDTVAEYVDVVSNSDNKTDCRRAMVLRNKLIIMAGVRLYRMALKAATGKTQNDVFNGLLEIREYFGEKTELDRHSDRVFYAMGAGKQ